MKNFKIKESTTTVQYDKIQSMLSRNYRPMGFDNQGFVMGSLTKDKRWFNKVRILRNGRMQKYKAEEPSRIDRQLFS